MTTCMKNGCSAGCPFDVFGGVLFCAVLFSREMSWMRSEIKLSQFLMIFYTYSYRQMFNVRLTVGHLYRKWLFSWRSLVMSLMVSYFVFSFSHEMSSMRSGTKFCQLLGVFPPSLQYP